MKELQKLINVSRDIERKYLGDNFSVNLDKCQEELNQFEILTMKDINFKIGKTITINGKEKFVIIAIAKNCSDGMRFDIINKDNYNDIREGCWLWDAGWYCI